MEKKIKSMLSMMLMLVAMFGVMSMTSCKDDDEKGGDENHDGALIGTWTLHEEEEDYEITETITLKSNGNGSYSWNEIEHGNRPDKGSVEFTWKTSGNKLYFITGGEEDDTDIQR